MNFEYGDRIKHKLQPKTIGVILEDTWLGYRVKLDEAYVTGGLLVETTLILYHLAEKVNDLHSSTR